MSSCRASLGLNNVSHHLSYQCISLPKVNVKLEVKVRVMIRVRIRDRVRDRFRLGLGLLALIKK